jgi:shikimate kinase
MAAYNGNMSVQWRFLMAVLVLIGFSCTGKSTTADRIIHTAGFEHVQKADTDEHIAHPYEGIFDVYMQLSEGLDRREADKHIMNGEIGFLQNFEPEEHSIIAAGPIIPRREPHFSEFLKRTNAKCISLSISGKTATTRLLNRQTDLATERPDLAVKANFGCWNWPHLMKYDESTTRYSLIENSDTREQLTTELLEGFKKTYAKVTSANYFVEDDKRRADLDERIKSMLEK